VPHKKPHRIKSAAVKSVDVGVQAMGSAQPLQAPWKFCITFALQRYVGSPFPDLRFIRVVPEV
jgi:hypothetical protein